MEPDELPLPFQFQRPLVGQARLDIGEVNLCLRP